MPLVGAVVIVEGAQCASQGVAAQRDDGLNDVRIVVGFVAVIVGAALLLYPDNMAPFQLYAVSGWAIIFGLFVTLLGLKDTDPASGLWEVTVGLCMTAFGLANWPVSGQVARFDLTPLQANMSRMRVIHASIEVPAIDIAIKGGEVFADDSRYGQFSDPRELQNGIFDLEARLQGTGVVVFDLPGEVVNPGMVHHLVKYGKPDDTETSLTVANLADVTLASMPATPTA